jgi:hypothetical protein
MKKIVLQSIPAIFAGILIYQAGELVAPLSWILPPLGVLVTVGGGVALVLGLIITEPETDPEEKI